MQPSTKELSVMLEPCRQADASQILKYSKALNLVEARSEIYPLVSTATIFSFHDEFNALLLGVYYFSLPVFLVMRLWLRLWKIKENCQT